MFTNLKKVFDRVQWGRLMGILKNKNIDWRDQGLIKQLYLTQTIIIHTAHGEAQPRVVGRGVRQECTLSLVLFNAYVGKGNGEKHFQIPTKG